MDDIDKKILRLLQKNARITISDLSSEIALSMPAISERLKKLEASGVIKQYAAILDPALLNKHLMAQIFIRLEKPLYCDAFTDFVKQENEIQECELEYNRYSEEFVELESLKEEIESNSDEGFEYGIQLIHENYIDDYLDEMLEDCGYLPKDLPYWIEIDWQATYDNMKEDYNEIELNGNTFYVR